MMAAKVGPLQTVLAQVLSVDEDAKTCVLDNDGVELFDVRMRPVLNGKEAVTLYPKVDSWVLAARIENDDDWMVMACDEVDKVRMKVGDVTLQITDKILLKKGDDTVKDMIDKIIDAVLPIVVIIGNNPDYAKLLEAKTMNNNIFTNAE